MQSGSDYTTSYYNYNHPPPSHLQNPNPNPNPNPSDPFLQSHASAPPFSNYSSSDYTPSTYSSPYPHYSQNSDPVPPTAPSYHQPYLHLQQQPPYYPYDPSPLSANPNPNPNPNPDSAYSATYPHSYALPAYENPSDGGEFGYPSSNSGRYGLGQTAPDLQTGFYEMGGRQFDQGRPHGGGFDEGVYAYDGGKDEPYGARGIGGFKSASSARFDDYGRSIGFEEEKVGSGKIVRASPKMEAQQDVKNGAQKFRVKLLPEGAGQTMDVLCQIGLDGIRMLDPNTNRTLRIYPLESVVRWEVTESSIYTFWAKSPVDFEPRRIRLQSNRYTTDTILDIVAAASVQLKEMGGNRIQGTADSGKPSEQTTEKKKGFPDWINFIKPGNEEKDHWVPDEAVNKCTACGTDFGAFVRRHHCRNCGDIFCDKCTQGRTALTADEQAQPVRVCDRCLAEVSQRLDNAKESKSAVQQSHEDLARKLQEEMDRNRKGSSGLKSTDMSGWQMKEVACPTCTVHLQVQVPTSGSETIECGVCQHPFLVSAH